MLKRSKQSRHFWGIGLANPPVTFIQTVHSIFKIFHINPSHVWKTGTVRVTVTLASGHVLNIEAWLSLFNTDFFWMSILYQPTYGSNQQSTRTAAKHSEKPSTAAHCSALLKVAAICLGKEEECLIILQFVSLISPFIACAVCLTIEIPGRLCNNIDQCNYSDTLKWWWWWRKIYFPFLIIIISFTLRLREQLGWFWTFLIKYDAAWCIRESCSTKTAPHHRAGPESQWSANE